MASFYWIKLYDEIIDDPKMGRLSDGAFRFCINVFLLANRHELRDGSLPVTEDIAWALRLPTDRASEYLSELEYAGIITMTGDAPRVTNFDKRQSPVDGKDRVKLFRERQRKNQFNEGETVPLHDKNEIVTKRYTDTDTDTDTKQETTVANDSAIVFYENNIGGLTPKISELIYAAIDDHTESVVVDAMGEAVANNVRKWNYVNAILENWKQNGRGKPSANRNGHSNDSSIWDTVLAHARRGDSSFTDNAVKAAVRVFGWPKLQAIKPGDENYHRKEFLRIYHEQSTTPA